MADAQMSVIFDTDPGIDDAVALLFLAACPEVNLLGLTIINGNAGIEDCTNNALYLCEQLGLDVPVHQGAAKGINGLEPEMYPDFVHGKNGLGDIDRPRPDRTIAPLSASEYLIKSATRHAGQLTLVAVGRLTNIALALQSEPAFKDKINQLIVMGGACFREGNVTPWAEANIIGDPEAAAIVFESGIPLTLVGLDVTMQTRMSLDFLSDVFQGSPDLRDLMLPMNSFYADYYKSLEGTDDFPVHDSSAVACLADPSLFKTRRGLLSCVLTGEKRGQTVLDESPGGPHQVCYDVDSEALLALFLQRVQAHYQP